MLENAVQTTLRTLDPRLSHMLLASNRPDALRRFAHACAEYAVRSGDVRDPVPARALDRAAAHAPTWPDEEELAPLKRAVSAIAERLDDAADEVRAAFETRTAGTPDEGGVPPIEYRLAFSKARAATSVSRCLEQSPFHAATLSCYEAFHATHRVGDLIRIGESFLSS